MRRTREITTLLDKATGSLLSGVERLHHIRKEGKGEAVVILLRHALEMLLCAAIVSRDGSEAIRRSNSVGTLPFDQKYTEVLLGTDKRQALRKSSTRTKTKKRSGKKRAILSESQIRTLYTLHKLRNAAQHYLLLISDEQLDMYAQLSIALFQDVYRREFKCKLEEVVPLKSLPRIQLQAMTNKPCREFFRKERESIRKEMRRAGKQTGFDTKERVRALAIFDAAVNIDFSANDLGYSDPSNDRVKELVKELRKPRRPGRPRRIPGFFENLGKMTIHKNGGITLR